MTEHHANISGGREDLVEVALTEIPAAHPVRVFADYYSDLAASSLPRRSQFSAPAVLRTLPYLIIFERQPGRDGRPTDYRVRYHGTEMVRRFGTDLTGDTVLNSMGPLAPGRVANLEQCLASRATSLYEARFPIPGKQIGPAYRGVFPFTDDADVALFVYLLAAIKNVRV